MTGIGVCEGNDHTRNQLHQQSRVLSHISLSKSVFLYIFLFFIYDSLSSSSQSWHLWAQADPVHPNSTHASSRESYTSLEQFDGQEASEERVESSLDEEDAAKTIEGLLFNWGSKWSTHKTSKDPAAVEASSHLYDAIVVGGGAAGCPLARTLADSGKEVLLIERGRARKDRPETLDIYGAGED